ncbi:hypothetical protein FMUBM48_56430 [Nocardia cyriacigeorgica]|nr:hypothetical protein FMUBM48_56430 [Nocardia cyriacigeorgica]
MAQAIALISFMSDSSRTGLLTIGEIVAAGAVPALSATRGAAFDSTAPNQWCIHFEVFHCCGLRILTGV